MSKDEIIRTLKVIANQIDADEIQFCRDHGIHTRCYHSYMFGLIGAEIKCLLIEAGEYEH